jgi:hypothetical protein
LVVNIKYILLLQAILPGWNRAQMELQVVAKYSVFSRVIPMIGEKGSKHSNYYCYIQPFGPSGEKWRQMGVLAGLRT